MRESEFHAVLGALGRLVGRRLGVIAQPARDRVVLGIGDEWLLIVPRGPLPRVHSIRGRPRNPASPFSFQGACRAHLGGPLTALVVRPDDRVVDLEFGPKRLHLRLTGRAGGLWLAEGDRVIAAFDGPAPEALPDLPPLPPRVDSPRFEPAAGEDWDGAARRYFEGEEARQALDQRRVATRKALRRHLDRALRLGVALEEDLDRAAEAPALRAQADALAAALHTIRRGATEAVVPDLDDPERIHRIALETGPPSVTLDRLYKRAKRLERGGDRIIDQIEATGRRAEALRQALEQVDDADEAGLLALRAIVPPDQAPRVAPADRDPWDTWIGPDGAVALVGRDADGNRRLTFQKARGRDFWMHLRDRPGAHLVLPMPEGRSPSKDLLLAGAQLLLQVGRIAEGTSADVQYARVRDLRPIKGEPGRVIVTDERVLHVRRDATSLVGWRREG